MQRVYLSFAVLLACLAPHSARAQTPDVCAGLVAQIDRPSLTDNPCALDAKSVTVETGYYQNASAVGQSQLAAYPEARVRYASLNRVELFADAPNAVAEAGPSWRGGRYTHQAGGFGSKWTIAQNAGSAFALSVEYGPPNAASSVMTARARYAASVAAGLRAASNVRLTGTLRLIDGHRFGVAQPGDVGLVGAFGVDVGLDRVTRVGLEAATSSRSRRCRAGAQGLVNAVVERALSRRIVVDANLGTVFNAVKESKPHYLGAGISYRL